jgi:hypothetical protein
MGRVTSISEIANRSNSSRIVCGRRKRRTLRRKGICSHLLGEVILEAPKTLRKAAEWTQSRKFH